jgi:hypothetical protein
VRRRVFVGLALPFATCALSSCGGSAHPAGLDRAAGAVADKYTQLAINEHDCAAATRYVSAGSSTAAAFMADAPCLGHSALSAGDFFPLESRRITRSCAGFGPSSNLSHVSPGCVTYTAADGDVVVYFMADTQQGWRILNIGTRRGH